MTDLVDKLKQVADHLRGIRREVNDCTARLECSECPGFHMVYSEKAGVYERHDCECIARIEDPMLRDEARHKKSSGRPHCRWTGD